MSFWFPISLVITLVFAPISFRKLRKRNLEEAVKEERGEGHGN